MDLITSIRATDVVLGLRRIPAGFYVVVHHSALEWKTGNKPVCVNNDVVEWDDHIPIPLDPSAIVELEIYASFEFQPVLGSGKQLRKLSITADQLLHQQALAFTFFPEDGDVVSPCSSLELTVGKCEYPTRGSKSLQSIARSQGQLENATDQGHHFLLRYQKHGEKQNLDRAIEAFECGLNACPLDHSCRAAAQSNLAMAKFIYYHVSSPHDDNLSLDAPLSLYHDALSARPVGHPDRPSISIHLAAVYFAQFVKGKDEADAKRAEELLEEVKDLTSEESHENRVAIFMLQLHAGRKRGDDHSSHQSSTEPLADSISPLPDENALTLGMQLLDSFERSGALDDLQQAITILESYVFRATVRDRKYLLGLTNVGMAFLHRFHCLGQLRDLDEAISKFKEAVGFVSDGHPRKPGWLSNLGNAFLSRFEQLQKMGDLEQAISSLNHAVDLIPDGHPQKVLCLSNAGNAFLTRFEHLWVVDDLSDAISRFKDALDLSPNGHPHRPVFMRNLGSVYRARFERLGETSDLEQAVEIFRNVVSLTSGDDPQKPDFLNDLGNCLFTLFERFGRLSDLEEAVSRSEDAVDLTPDGHPRKSSRLNALGNCLQARFDRLDRLDDLEQAISRFSSAVELTSDDYPLKYGYLNNLGSAYLARFKRFGDPNDLDRAIYRCRDAVELSPNDHSYKPACLGDLGRSLIFRFERFGELTDLEEAVSRGIDAVDLTPDGHIEKPGRLQTLGNAFKARFERLGDLGDLEQALAMHENAVALTPDDHPDKASRLSSLGNSFRARFGLLGKLEDLEQAISMQKSAVKLTPDGHPDKPGRQVSLGISLTAHFEYIGDLGDLEQVISSLKDAANVIPDDPVCLNALAASYSYRFDRLGKLGDLEQAVSIFKDVDHLVPNDDPQKPGCLNNIGISLKARFDRLEELSDLEQSVSRLLEAVDISHEDNPQKHIFLNNLGNSLFARFEHSGEPSDLEQAILQHGGAVDFTPDGHPAKPGYLTNYGNSLEARFKLLGEPSDIVQAISRRENALTLTPDGHPDKPACLNNLGNSFKARFDRLDELQDLEQAISKFRGAVNLTPDGHPDTPGRLNNLASSLFIRFERLQQVGDLEQVISLYSRAARASTGPTIARFDASEQWIHCARISRHHSLLDAYSCTISLLPQLAWMGFPLTRRYRELLRRADVVREAAAAALDSGRMETAVEWLEQGRSIIWGGLFQLRSSYDELESVDSNLAHKLRQLSAALERASATRERSLSLLSEHAQDVQYTVQTLEQEADMHRKLAIERDALLEEVRRLPGFERFLLHKKFSQLRALAHSGPVVILNTAERRCDALIVAADKDVIHVPFPNFTLKRLEGLQASLKSMLHTREGKRARLDHAKKWKTILSILWKSVVKPVLDALEISIPGNPSRVFWCPTGPFTFIPIHAAGLYDDQYSPSGNKLSDFVVSSYVPTLSVLVPKGGSDSNEGLRFLAVRQPPTDGLRPLPGVDEELRYIEAIIQNAPSSQIKFSESSVGTVEEVLELMKDADWVHFACHGTQDDDQPTNSGLCLADGRRLKLSDMIGPSRPRGGLAFLSACETAMGDKGLSDEAIHIAAGMLFAGYGSVVATMWSISDRIAPELARDVYERLFRDGARPDVREAAHAMQDAVVRVRDGGASFEEWLPFIHVGA